MSVFAEYARYYDLLYKDKPYADEAAYIIRVLKKHVPAAKTLVELGCGSGVHAAYLAQAGFSVDGVDQSDWMLARANQRRVAFPDRLRFHKGDVRDIRLGIKADAVISLFHVVSYQTADADVKAMFDTAAAHLESGGIFFFDVWYDEAVLHEKPERRVKELEDDEFKIIRIATPTLHADRNVVDVHYKLTAHDKQKHTASETEEVHRMRYFSTQELETFSVSAGFILLDTHAWMTEEKPGPNSWGVSFVCKKS